MTFSVGKITNPPGVTDGLATVSKTAGQLSTSEYILNIVSDALPDPGEYAFSYSPNTNTVLSRSFNHSIRYRGGTNTVSLTPATTGQLGIASTGAAFFGASLGAVLENDSGPAAGNAPSGFDWNAGLFLSNYGADSSNGYPDDNNQYHYFDSTFLLSDKWKGVAKSNPYYADTNYQSDNFRHPDGHSKIIGISFDGYPIYGPYGYINPTDSGSGVQTMSSSYTLRTTEAPGRTFSYAQYSEGSFIQDYTYSVGSGTLDSSNGRYCVTPDFPDGTYAYFTSVAFSLSQQKLIPTYPYIFGPNMRQTYYQPGGLAVSDPGGSNPEGPSAGGFDILSIFSDGITVRAGAGDNDRSITAYPTDSTGTSTYTWQISFDGTNWTDLQSNDQFSFSDTPEAFNGILTFNDSNDYIDNSQIRVKATDFDGVTVAYSYPIPVQYVGSLVTITEQPVDQNILAGQTATFSVSASVTDDIQVSYQWYERVYGTNTWTAISGETTNTLELSGNETPISKNQYDYKCAIVTPTAENSPIESDIVTLFVGSTSFTISSQPQNTTVNEGQTASFTVTTNITNGTTPTYQWQLSTDLGSNWSDLGGETSTTLSFATAYSQNNYYYRVVCTAPGVAVLTSNVVSLTVQRTIAIAQNPQNVSVYETQNASFSALATTSSGTPTYQWQESTDSGENWSDIIGEVSDTLNLSAVTSSEDGYQYRYVADVTGSGGSITSNPATLTVLVRPTLVISTQPANGSVFQPDSASFSVSAASSDASDITYQWETSSDNGSTWSVVTGATSSSYNTGSTSTVNDNQRRYRVIISHPAAVNSPLTSDFAVLTVTTPVISITQQPQSVQTFANIPVTYTVSASVTSGKVITYQWQQSIDGGSNYANINGATSNNYTITGTGANNGYLFRCIVGSLGATSVASSGASLSLTYIQLPTVTAASFIDTTTSKTFVRAPRFESSLFLSYLGNGHESSFWKITRTSDSVVVYSTEDDLSANGDNIQKIEFQSPELDWEETYQVQVKYKDSQGFETAFSNPVAFTTPAADQPTFNEPIETALRPTIYLNNISYNTASYTHTSTDWQIASDPGYASLVYESLNDSVNLTEITVPNSVILDASKNYYVRARINVT